MQTRRKIVCRLGTWQSFGHLGMRGLEVPGRYEYIGQNALTLGSPCRHDTCRMSRGDTHWCCLIGSMKAKTEPDSILAAFRSVSGQAHRSRLSWYGLSQRRVGLSSASGEIRTHHSHRKRLDLGSACGGSRVQLTEPSCEVSVLPCEIGVRQSRLQITRRRSLPRAPARRSFRST